MDVTDSIHDGPAGFLDYCDSAVTCIRCGAWFSRMTVLFIWELLPFAIALPLVSLIIILIFSLDRLIPVAALASCEVTHPMLYALHHPNTR